MEWATVADSTHRDLIPTTLRDDWRAKALFVSRSRWAVVVALPFAIARAESVQLFGLPYNEGHRLAAKYMAELNRIPLLHRLRPNQRWLETHDDKYLPAGLYERKTLHRWLYQHVGWRSSAFVWLLRNRAYQVANRFRFEHREGVTEYRTWGAGSMEPFVAGEWLCIAYVHGEARAFEYSRTWEYDWLSSKVGQEREGWALRPLAQGDRPTGPTATGRLIAGSWRPLQSRPARALTE